MANNELQSLIEAFTDAHGMRIDLYQLSESQLMALYESDSWPEESKNSRIYEDYIQALGNMFIKNQKVVWEYDYAPFFTDLECVDLQRQIEGVMQLNTNRPNVERTNPQDFKDKIRDLQAQLYKTKDPEEIKKLKDQIILLGWNPEVNFDGSTNAAAKVRLTEAYQGEVNRFRFINCIRDIEKVNTIMPITENTQALKNLVPIFIEVFHGTNKANIYTDNFSAPYSVKEAGKVTVYGFFVEQKTKLKPIDITPVNLYGYKYNEFMLPKQVVAARCAECVYDMYESDISEYQPIIKILYEGKYDDIPRKQIMEFTNFCLLNGVRSKPYLEEEHYMIPAVNYYTTNLLKDQYKIKHCCIL